MPDNSLGRLLREPKFEFEMFPGSTIMNDPTCMAMIVAHPLFNPVRVRFGLGEKRYEFEEIKPLYGKKNTMVVTHA